MNFRMIDADRGGFASARVMVNLNQLGEAAGVAACTAIEENKTVCDINTDKLREKLKIGGSIVL